MKSKSIICIILCIAVFFFLVFSSCKKSAAGPSQQSPTFTPTKTSTQNQSPTNTCTGTYTLSVTVTETPTVTVTSSDTATITETPTPLKVDDFEDGDYENMLPTTGSHGYGWQTSNNTKEALVFYNSPGNGAGGSDYYVAMTGYACSFDGASSPYLSSWALVTYTYSDGNNKGFDFSPYNKIKFSWKTSHALPANATISCKVTMANDIGGYRSNTCYLPAAAAPTGSWAEVTVNKSDFNNGLWTVDQMWADCAFITWYADVYIVDQGQCYFYEVDIDNISFE